MNSEWTLRRSDSVTKVAEQSQSLGCPPLLLCTGLVQPTVSSARVSQDRIIPWSYSGALVNKCWAVVASCLLCKLDVELLRALAGIHNEFQILKQVHPKYHLCP